MSALIRDGNAVWKRGMNKLIRIRPKLMSAPSKLQAFQ
jgi:hypothetical protein